MKTKHILDSRQDDNYQAPCVSNIKFPHYAYGLYATNAGITIKKVPTLICCHQSLPNATNAEIAIKKVPTLICFHQSLPNRISRNSMG